MNKQDFSDVMNNMKDLTLKQIITLIGKLKYRTIAMIVTFVIAVLGGAFAAGKYSHSKSTAVMLHKPFAMRISIDNKNHDFETLTLVKDPLAPVVVDDKVVLSLREIKSSFDIIPVGRVVASIEENKLTGIWHAIISKTGVAKFVDEAYAHEPISFNWNGHEQDYNFKEGFVDKNTVHRYYSDGCILAYNVDNNRRSIPGTFRWIELTH